MEQGPGTIIRATSVSKTYADGGIGVRSVDLQVQKGELVGLLGRSGAGKTTLLRLLNGTLRCDTGSLEVLGVDVGSLRSRQLRSYRHQVGVVYQQHGLVPSLSVLHNVLLGRLGAMGGLRSLTRLLYVPAEQVRAVAESLDELGVHVPLSRRASDLSGGQQQRVAVARALWQSPRLLLADEPVASVDAETAESILNALKQRNEHNALTVLVSLHQRDLAMRFCSRVVVLDDGGVVYDGSPGELDRRLKASPVTSYKVEEATVVRA